MKSIEYRPSTALGLAMSAVLLVTAIVLVWLGTILGPDDREAMDGLVLLLFTAIPIRLFAWTMAVVFLVIGGATARAVLRRTPTLRISQDGLTLRSGPPIPWSRLRSANLTADGLLELGLGSDDIEASKRRGLLARLVPGRAKNRIVLSSLDLGADPAEVAQVIQERLAVPPNGATDVGPNESA